MENFGQITSFIWGVADLIRDTFKRGKYQDVILPLTVLRRLDCVLEPTKLQVLERYNELKGKLDNLDPQLRRASGHAFYNTSRFTFETLLQDSTNIAANLRAWINGFSENMREVLEKFDFDNTITKLDQAGLLFLVLERFKSVDLHPNQVDNFTMGSIFEELIRKFNEALNENPGEHFTPRDVIHLMVALMVAPDREKLAGGSVVRTIYDPCCGSGGMLTIARQEINELNPEADIHLYGQEVNPETFAICKSDLFLKTEDGRDAENIVLGSTLSTDVHAGVRFDYLIANPPYGKDWKMDRAAVKAEHDRGFAGRFGAGLPGIKDGQLLFLQHMVAHMKAPDHGGSRIAVITNGSALFTGDAGSGQSEIRRWLLGEDLVEAIIALPDDLFYNTPMGTYIWLMSNRKPPARQGKVRLIDASGPNFWTPLRQSLGDKRRYISKTQALAILSTYLSLEDGEFSKTFPPSTFGYRKVRVERPRRLRYCVNPDRIEQIKKDKSFQGLLKCKKKDQKAREVALKEGHKLQASILSALEDVSGEVFNNRQDLEAAIGDEMSALKLKVGIREAILAALAEPCRNADIYRDAKGKHQPDSDLRILLEVPLGESIQDHFNSEVKHHFPNAWIDDCYTDDQDGGLGKVGYEINFNKYFYFPSRHKELKDLQTGITGLVNESEELLAEIRTLLDFNKEEHDGASLVRTKKRTGQPWVPTVPEHWDLIPNRVILRKKLKVLVGENHASYTLLSLTKTGVIIRDISAAKGKFSADPGTCQEVHSGDFVFCFFDVPETPRTVGLSNHDGMITSAYTLFECEAPDVSAFVELYYIALDDKKLLSPLYTGLRKTIPADRFLTIKTPLPPASERKAIISFLDRGTRVIDRVIGNEKELIEMLNELRSALIAEAVTGGIQVRKGISTE